MANSETLEEIISHRVKDREKIREAMEIQDQLRKKKINQRKYQDH